MPRYHQLKTNFVAGEFDPLLIARSDIKHYYNAAERARNVVVLPEGGTTLRPGSRYLWTVPDVPAEDGGGPSNVRLANFQFNTEQTYLFVFHHRKLSIFRNRVLQATIDTPWSSSNLIAHETEEGDLISSGISWTQSKDTMIVFHESYPMKQIKRMGSHSSWSLSDYQIDNIPRYNFGIVYTDPDQVGVNEVQQIEFPNPGNQGDWVSGDTFSLLLEDEETENIRYAGDADLMRDRLQAALRALDNTSANGITVTHSGASGALTPDVQFTVTFAGKDGQRPWGSMFYTVKSSQQVPSIDIFVVTKGRHPGEDVWSEARGYPRCGVFFQGRLWVAGTPSLPHWVWASKIGAPNDFNSKLFADDYGIAAPADTDDVPAFIAIYPGRHLQLFSTSAEFYVPVSENEAVTPGNIVLRRTTSRGIKPGTRVFEVDGATHFVQRRGKALREFIFTDVEQAYQANNISLLAPHLMRNPLDFALRRSTSTTDADYEFMPNEDGTMTVFCTLRLQEVNAMFLWATQGEYKAACSILEEVYFATLRTVNGTARMFIEVMDDDLTIDCALSGDGVAASAQLAHLPNTEIEHLLDGIIQQSVVSSSNGTIDFARASVDGWVAGLKFAAPDPDHPDLIWIVKTLPIELDLPDGTTLGRKRRIVNLSVRLWETSALIVNGNRQAFRKYGANLLDKPVEPYTGVRNIRGLLGWDYDGSVVLGGDQSLKASILALSFAVSI